MPSYLQFILCFLFIFLSLDIYNPSPLYMFAVSTMNLLHCLFLRCQAPIEQMETVFATTRSLFKPTGPWPADQKKRNSQRQLMQHTEVSASVCYCFDFICVFSPVIFKKLECVFYHSYKYSLARQSDFSSLARWSVSKNNIKPPQLKKISQQKICAT